MTAVGFRFSSGSRVIGWLMETQQDCPGKAQNAAGLLFGRKPRHAAIAIKAYKTHAFASKGKCWDLKSNSGSVPIC